MLLACFSVDLGLYDPTPPRHLLAIPLGLAIRGEGHRSDEPSCSGRQKGQQPPAVRTKKRQFGGFGVARECSARRGPGSINCNPGGRLDGVNILFVKSKNHPRDKKKGDAEVFHPRAHGVRKGLLICAAGVIAIPSGIRHGRRDASRAWIKSPSAPGARRVVSRRGTEGPPPFGAGFAVTAQTARSHGSSTNKNQGGFTTEVPRDYLAARKTKK